MKRCKRVARGYGILGDWGSGKTSILRLLEEQVRSDPGLVPIFFNPWKYENDASLIYPLLHTIKELLSTVEKCTIFNETA
jgi:predicted KAP-like P-loop ATPase